MEKISRRNVLKGMAGGALWAAPFASLSETQNRIPLIFDTDIGSDIDDALTMVYLLGQQRCELLGVTTAYGDTLDRARLVSAICAAAGREVQIHPGSSELINGKIVTGRVPQAEILSQWPHRDDFEPDRAEEFILKTITSRPGQVTLLATGPLTNVARLFQRHPEAPMLLKSLTLMNGSFRIMYPEYNAILDPEATRIVYETETPEMTVIDFETSLKCQMWKKEARQRIRGGAFEPVAEMMEVFFRILPVVTFYDSIAAASIFEPGLVTFRSTTVKSRRGWTFPSRASGPHQVSVDVDAKRFKEHFFKTVKGV
jgi:purine nucleosidase